MWRHLSLDGSVMQREGARSPQVAKAPRPLQIGSAEFGVGGWRQIADTAVGPHRVVVVHPDRQNLSHMGELGEQRLISSSSRSRPLKLSTKAFCCGLPGAM